MLDYKLVIFDWDGTLMDSVERIVSSMQAVAIYHHFIVPDVEQIKSIIGLSLPVALTKLFPDCTQVPELIECYKKEYTTNNTVETPLFDGVLLLLNKLKLNDKLVAVATGKGRQGLNRVMRESKTEHYFHASCCGDEAKSKPDPQMISFLLEQLDVAPHEAVMIGDTSYDMEMAQRAGIDCIGVTMGVHDSDVLSRYTPKAIVDSFSELQQLLLLS